MDVSLITNATNSASGDESDDSLAPESSSKQHEWASGGCRPCEYDDDKHQRLVSIVAERATDLDSARAEALAPPLSSRHVKPAGPSHSDAGVSEGHTNMSSGELLPPQCAARPRSVQGADCGTRQRLHRAAAVV